MTGSFLKMSHVGNFYGRNTMSEQLAATTPTESAFVIAIAIHAIPPPATHAHATPLLVYTRRHGTT